MSEAAAHRPRKPSVILVIGVNGVGKTTTIGKMAAHLKSPGAKRCCWARRTPSARRPSSSWKSGPSAPGWIWCKHTEGADPAAVVFDAITAAKASGCDVVICDTAGRLHNKKNLMDELAKISRVIEPGGRRL